MTSSAMLPTTLSPLLHHCTPTNRRNSSIEKDSDTIIENMIIPTNIVNDDRTLVVEKIHHDDYKINNNNNKRRKFTTLHAVNDDDQIDHIDDDQSIVDRMKIVKNEGQAHSQLKEQQQQKKKVNMKKILRNSNTSNASTTKNRVTTVDGDIPSSYLESSSTSTANTNQCHNKNKNVIIEKSVRFNLLANTIHSLLRPNYINPKMNLTCIFDDVDDNNEHDINDLQYNEMMKEILWYSPYDLLVIKLRECMSCQSQEKLNCQQCQDSAVVVLQQQLQQQQYNNNNNQTKQFDNELSELYYIICNEISIHKHHKQQVTFDSNSSLTNNSSNNNELMNEKIMQLFQSMTSLSTPSSFNSSSSISYRGLERWSCPQLVRIRTFYTWLCQTIVFIEQSSYDNNHNDISLHNDHNERISYIYHSYSLPAQTLAYIFGHMDSISIIDYKY